MWTDDVGCVVWGTCRLHGIVHGRERTVPIIPHQQDHKDTKTSRHHPPLGWEVNGTVSIRYKYIGEAFHATQRQTKSLKETSVSMILRSLRCWWWFTRKPVMVLCLYNSFQHRHSKRVPNYVTTTNNGQNWTIFECGPFHDH